MPISTHDLNATGGDALISDMIPIIRTFQDRPDITIYPISDLHIGAPEFMEKEWEAFKKRLLNEPNSYITIGGDMMNNATKSSVSNVYGEVLRPREQKARLVEELTLLKDKILCGISGNHENRSAREVDDNPLYDVFCKLGIEERYRENGAFMILRFGTMSRNGLENPTYTMAVLHGAGGGMYIGSSANKLETYGSTIDNLDILISGHTHKPLTYPVDKLVFDTQNKRITHKQFRVVVATSWLGYSDYAMRGLMKPTAHCLQRITLAGRKKHIEVAM